MKMMVLWACKLKVLERMFLLAKQLLPVGKIAAVDGAGGVIDSAETAKLRGTPVVVEVDATAETATVFLGWLANNYRNGDEII